VLQRADPTLIPLTVTVETWLRKAYLPALRAAGPLAQLIARQAEAFAADEQVGVRYGQSYPGLPGDIVNFQHDPLACAIALGWNKGVETREVRLQMALKDDLLCQRPAAGGKPTRVVTRVDGAAFSREWLRLVTGAAPVDSGRRFD
jgi:inosine-uridine nucleoside N-ribohydrolase